MVGRIQPVERVEMTPETSQTSPSCMPIPQLFVEVAEEESDSVRSAARKMINYAVARGGVPNVRPQVLENIAIQFAVLEAAYRRILSTDTGEMGVVPEEMRLELFIEGFRLVASQARKLS